jgi:hypothetical protein
MARLELHMPLVEATAKTLARDEVRKLAQRVEGSAKRLVRTDTGRLRTSIGTNVTETRWKVKARVGSTARYALVEHEGATAHIIRARRKMALSFFWPKVGAQAFVPLGGFPGTGYMIYNGRNIFMIGKGYVNHPGTEGSFYLTHPLLQHAPQFGFRVVLTPRGGGDAA